jgi:hypothetical protein
MKTILNVDMKVKKIKDLRVQVPIAASVSDRKKQIADISKNPEMLLLSLLKVYQHEAVMSFLRPTSAR